MAKPVKPRDFETPEMMPAPPHVDGVECNFTLVWCGTCHDVEVAGLIPRGVTVWTDRLNHIIVMDKESREIVKRYGKA